MSTLPTIRLMNKPNVLAKELIREVYEAMLPIGEMNISNACLCGETIMLYPNQELPYNRVLKTVKKLYPKQYNLGFCKVTGRDYIGVSTDRTMAAQIRERWENPHFRKLVSEREKRELMAGLAELEDEDIDELDMPFSMDEPLPTHDEFGWFEDEL